MQGFISPSLGKGREALSRQKRVSYGEKARMRRESVTERIFHALFIARAGLTCREIAGIIYADDPAGGALAYNKTISVLIFRLNRDHLVPIGAKIVADWGPGSRYRLEMQPYDSVADVEGSFSEAYRAVRTRKINGGPGWAPK